MKKKEKCIMCSNVIANFFEGQIARLNILIVLLGARKKIMNRCQINISLRNLS